MTEKTFVPLYRKVYLDLKKRILEREYKPGEKLPYERELCDAYGVKRVTIRKSLEMLAEEGLIVKHMGLGSFVSGDDETANHDVPDAGATILFVMRRNENDIYHNTSSCNTRIFFEMEQICRKNGYLLSYAGIDEQTSLSDLVRDHQVCGVFLASSYLEKVREEIAGLKIPAVMLNQYAPELLSVMPDNLGMVQLVVSHLKEMGHKRIAYVDGMPDSYNAQERWESFRFAMYDHGLTVDESLYFAGNWTFDGGRAAARRMLALKQLPTAVFSASDMMAAGVMEELRQNGLRVPEDISVIGYDNLEIDMMLSPPLSSAAVDFKHMCEVAFEHLGRILEHGDREQDHYVIRMPASLICRESVGRLKDV